jgi:NADH-quinone oxidoreductase subunit L
MIFPLIALAGCTVLIGLVCVVAGPFWGTTAWFAHHLRATFGLAAAHEAEHGFAWLTAMVGTVVGLGGIALAYLMYGEPSPLPSLCVERLHPLYLASRDKFRVDELYGWVIVWPVRALAAVCDFCDTYVVDGLVSGVANFPRRFGQDVLARYQNGLIQFYAAASALSVAVLLFILLLL